MKNTGFSSLPTNKAKKEYIEILRSEINNSAAPYVAKFREFNKLPIPPPPPRKGGRRTNKRRTEKKQRKSSKKRKNNRKTKKSNKK